MRQLTAQKNRKSYVRMKNLMMLLFTSTKNHIHVVIINKNITCGFNIIRLGNVNLNNKAEELY